MMHLLISLFELKRGQCSVYLPYQLLKKLLFSPLSLLNNRFFAYIYKKLKNMTVQRNIHGSHVALFKTLNFMVLFCFTSSDQPEMVD